MNQLLTWLKHSTNRHTRLEEKNSVGSLIAFHSAGNAIWSTMDGSERASQAFAKNPVVYRCVRMISEAASSVPFAVRENRVEINEHPLLDLLTKPNSRQSGPKFLECLFSHLLIAGNVYLTKIEVNGKIS